MHPLISFTRWLLAAAVFVFLAGCAGTVQRDSQSGAKQLEGTTYKSVDVVMTDAAKRLQAENPQFNARELGNYVQRRLDAANLVKPDGRHRVEVTVEGFRVRNAFAAVMFGFMAGSDSIDGYVKVFDERNRQVHGYKVNASYALGGWAGGQDGMRMNWMYDKFSELTVAELAGTTHANSLSTNRPADPSRPRPAPVASTAAAPKPVAAPSVTPQPVAATQPVAARAAPALAVAPAVVVPAAPAAAIPTLATGYARVDDVDAVPFLADKGRESYRDWLTRSTPRAFALSPEGHWAATWTLTPANASHPRDPGERAMFICQERSKGLPCRLYAVNGAVVWPKDGVQFTSSPRSQP